jgi:hypothetical protein
MSTADRTDYWLQRIEKDKLGVVARLTEYEAEIERAQQPPAVGDRRQIIEELLESTDANKSILDGLDAAIIGVSDTNMDIVYSKTKILEVLKCMGMTYIEALDFYEFNTLSVAEQLGIVIVDDTIF